MATPDEVTGPINIGNPVELSIHQLADKIVEKTGCKVELEHLDLPEDDPKQRQPDISRATKLLDWTPKVSLNEGLDRTIAYFRDLLQPNSAEGAGAS
jgi:UDP-glucuronate decarboxylase